MLEKEKSKFEINEIFLTNLKAVYISKVGYIDTFRGTVYISWDDMLIINQQLQHQITHSLSKPGSARCMK